MYPAGGASWEEAPLAYGALVPGVRATWWWRAPKCAAEPPPLRCRRVALLPRAAGRFVACCC